MTRLVVLAGPTAVGKGTVVRELRARIPNLWVSVSATTRPLRPGEVDGEDYVFLTEQTFTEFVETGEFLEWAIVHGQHRYGTLRDPVVKALSQGRPCLLEIDLQGARQVRDTMPEAMFVFLAPPAWEELERRLETRGTEDLVERERRLATAREELAAMDEFEHVIVNDTVEGAATALQELIESSR